MPVTAIADRDRNRHRSPVLKVIKKIFGKKRDRCRRPKDGQVITWQSKKDRWVPKYLSCGRHKAPDGISDGDTLAWSADHRDWLDSSTHTETVEGNLVVTGSVQSLNDGFIFPDGTVQTTAAQGIQGPVRPLQRQHPVQGQPNVGQVVQQHAGAVQAVLPQDQARAGGERSGGQAAATLSDERRTGPPPRGGWVPVVDQPHRGLRRGLGPPPRGAQAVQAGQRQLRRSQRLQGEPEADVFDE